MGNIGFDIDIEEDDDGDEDEGAVGDGHAGDEQADPYALLAHFAEVAMIMRKKTKCRRFKADTFEVSWGDD